MTSSAPSSPGPCMDTSIFSMRGYRALCLACSLEKTALRWLRTSARDGRWAAAADAKPVDGQVGWKEELKGNQSVNDPVMWGSWTHDVQVAGLPLMVNWSELSMLSICCNLYFISEALLMSKIADCCFRHLYKYLLYNYLRKQKLRSRLFSSSSLLLLRLLYPTVTLKQSFRNCHEFVPLYTRAHTRRFIRYTCCHWAGPPFTWKTTMYLTCAFLLLIQ